MDNVDFKNRLCRLETNYVGIENRLGSLEKDNIEIKKRLSTVENRLTAVEHQIELLLEKLEMMRFAKKVRIFRTTEEGHMKEVFVTLDEVVGETTLLDAPDGDTKVLKVAEATAGDGKSLSNPFSFEKSVADQVSSGGMKVFLSYLGRPILIEDFKALCLDDILSDHYCGRCVQVEMTVKEPLNIAAVDEKLLSFI